MSASCESCRFFSSVSGECRRNPPTLMLVQPAFDPGMKAMYSYERVTRAWPNVGMSDWCGEYSSKRDRTFEELDRAAYQTKIALLKAENVELEDKVLKLGKTLAALSGQIGQGGPTLGRRKNI